MNAQGLVIVTLAVVLSVMQCAPVAQRAQEPAAPLSTQIGCIALIGTDSADRVILELGLVNRQSYEIASRDDLLATWELRTDGDALIAGGSLNHLPALAPGESVFPITWRGNPSPGHYRLTWGAPALHPREITFQVVSMRGRTAVIIERPPRSDDGAL